MSPSPCTVCGKVRGFGGRQCHGHDVPAPTREEAALAEVTRLRAALQSTAALQTEESFPTSTGSEDDYKHGVQDGEYKAAEMAREALVSK